MTRERLDATALARFKRSPIEFIEHVLCDPETGQPFTLSEAERQFLERAFTLNDNGKLTYPEQVFGAIKKSGKTTLAAIIMLTMILIFGSRFAEGYCVANDLEQAQSRVFAIVKRIVEASPLLRGIAKLTSDRVTFPALGATIIAIASDAAGAAGANPTISCFDELWGVTSERGRRLWDEMITSPARKISCRLTVSYAGFTGESVLLEETLQARHGPARGWPEPARWRWHVVRLASRADFALADRKLVGRNAPQLKAQCLRAHDREPVRQRRKSSFVDLGQWDACVQPELTPSTARLPVYIGIDASTKRDSTALCAVSFDKKSSCVRLVAHRVFTPTAGDPIDFEATVERTILDWRQRYILRQVSV